MNRKPSKLNLPNQGNSESSGFGERRVLDPDPPPSLSCVGLTKEEEENTDSFKAETLETSDKRILKDNPYHRGSQEFFSNNKDTPEEITKILEILLDLGGDNTFSNRRRIHLVIDTVLTYINDLSTVMNKLNLARRYIMSKVNRQEEQIENLQDEIDNLKSAIARKESATELKEPRELLSSLEHYYRRDRTWMEDVPEDRRCEDSGRWSVSPSSSKLDNMTTLATLLDNSNDFRTDGFLTMERAGRARRRGEASRPRGRSPRITNQELINMDMNLNGKEKLPPQESRTSSDRRTSPTVPEARSSSSNEGLSPRLPTGVEDKHATVEIFEDPLEMTTFVDCSSPPMGIILHQQELNRSFGKKVTPEPGSKSKRKAKTSPDVITPSDEEKGGSKKEGINLRKLRPRKKRAQSTNPKAEVTVGDSSLESLMSVETERSSESESKSERRKSLQSLKTRSRRSNRIIISSDEEEANKDFAPQDLKIMGATNVGALGLDCLERIENMRARSKNLQGGISGRMRRDLERAKEVINTLIFKSEASGDPAYLKIKNIELTAEIEKLKLKDILRERELEEMRAIVEELRKEVSEFRDKQDELEEDRRKARESQRITQYKLKKALGKEIEEEDPIVEPEKKKKKILPTGLKITKRYWTYLLMKKNLHTWKLTPKIFR
ncbi:putative autophagy-related protein 11 [Polyergus mexicanus]|uniref:putative autophagy-related protein 11 n=1 Tax=Polyergus mexicanus TaxID=615972 RepID=UPI0038B52629